eukprot:m.71960 g.71960  ORF g.71960 m.71960 type:complete len:76 (+) comp11719_c0_seq23:268-495(+)
MLSFATMLHHLLKVNYYFLFTRSILSNFDPSQLQYAFTRFIIRRGAILHEKHYVSKIDSVQLCCVVMFQLSSLEM